MGAFNPNIPMAGNFLAVSQKQILSNFQAIANTFLIDHEPLTAVEDVGMHTTLTLRPQVIDPTTAADQSAIYNKLDGSNVPQLFFRPSSNQTPIQLSNANLNTIQTGSPVDAQSSFLAGPFTIYMGYFLDIADGQVITLLPSSTLIYVGISTILNGNVPIGLATTATSSNMTSNQFTVTYLASQFMGTIGNNPIPVLIKPSIYYTAVGI